MIVRKDTFSSHGPGPMVQAVIDIPHLVRDWTPNTLYIPRNGPHMREQNKFFQTGDSKFETCALLPRPRNPPGNNALLKGFFWPLVSLSKALVNLCCSSEGG